MVRSKVTTLIRNFERMSIFATIGGGFRPQGLTDDDQCRVITAVKTMAGSIPRYTYSKPLRVNEEQHISFKRPDDVMRRANMAMKNVSLVITIDIDVVDQNEPPWEVAKMLTDTGSSIDIVSLGTLKKMELEPRV